jgi:hypothetical protein
MTEQRPYSIAHSIEQEERNLVQGAREFTLAASPAPLEETGIIVGLFLVGSIASRQWNVGKVGLNQNILFAAPSGTGKGTIKSSIDALTGAIAKTVPGIIDWQGMGYPASGPAILRHLASKHVPVSMSVFDEFGADLAQMANPNNSNGQSKRQVFRQLWSASGVEDVFDPMAYSDQTKNTAPLLSPNFNWVGCAPKSLIQNYRDRFHALAIRRTKS